MHKLVDGWTGETVSALYKRLSTYLDIGQDLLEARKEIRKRAEDEKMRELLSPIWYEYCCEVRGYVRPYELFMKHWNAADCKKDRPRALSHSLTVEQANAVAKAFSKNDTEVLIIAQRLAEIVQVKESSWAELYTAAKAAAAKVADEPMPINTPPDEIASLAEKLVGRGEEFQLGPRDCLAL